MVISDHQKSVSCISTDRVMRYSEFQQLCQRVSTNEGVRSVEAQLLLDRKITKRRTDKGWEVEIVWSYIDTLSIVVVSVRQFAPIGAYLYTGTGCGHTVHT